MREFLKVADSWLRLADHPAPGLSGTRFSVFVDGHFTARKTYLRAEKYAGGATCTSAWSYDSPLFDESGPANALLDVSKLIATGHVVGHHAHCHETDGEDPDHRYWMNRTTT